MKYIICTVDTTYSEPLTRLIESMLINGIEEKDILLSVQSKYHIHPIVKKHWIQVGNKILSFYGVYCYKELYEYSFFNSCKTLLDSGLISSNDSYFMLHDTCIILENHKTLINGIMTMDFFGQVDMIFADQLGRHNIGIYNYNSILYGYNIWKNITKISKQLAIDIEHNRPGTEEYNIKTKRQLRQYRFDAGINDVATAYVYNYDNLRTVSRLHFFGIDKFFYHVDPNRGHPNKP